MENVKLGLGKLISSWKISLHTLCLLTSAYFVQDGFVTGVNSIFRLLFLQTLHSDAAWELLDGVILFVLGYACILGLEHGSLNLLRWPTLLLFIYKVFEYFVEQVFRQLKDRGDSHSKLTYDPVYPHRLPRLEWTGHFLIPSLHIVGVTLFLYRHLRANSSQDKKLAKFVTSRSKSSLKFRKGSLGGGNYAKVRNSTTSLSQGDVAGPSKRKFHQKKPDISGSTSFSEEKASGESNRVKIGVTEGESWSEDEENVAEETILEDQICLLEFNGQDEE